MAVKRKDIRNTAPKKSHQAAFLTGWREAEKGTHYKSNLAKKTHANMGNLFGWIFGKKPKEFKVKTWEWYLENTLDIEEK